jgi:hypothetical protein
MGGAWPGSGGSGRGKQVRGLREARARSSTVLNYVAAGADRAAGRPVDGEGGGGCGTGRFRRWFGTVGGFEGLDNGTVEGFGGLDNGTVGGLAGVDNGTVGGLAGVDNGTVGDLVSVED